MTVISNFCGESDCNYSVVYLAVSQVGLGLQSEGRVGWSSQSKVTRGQLSVECLLFDNSIRYVSIVFRAVLTHRKRRIYKGTVSQTDTKL